MTDIKEREFLSIDELERCIHVHNPVDLIVCIIGRRIIATQTVHLCV